MAFDSYIEVKSHTVRESELEDIMRRMPVIWESQPRALLAIQLWDQRRDPPRSSPACTAARSAVTRAGV